MTVAGGPIGGIAPPDPPLPALVGIPATGGDIRTASVRVGSLSLSARVVGTIRAFPALRADTPLLLVPVRSVAERFAQILRTPDGGAFSVLAMGASDPTSSVRRAGLQVVGVSRAASIEARLGSSPQNLALGMKSRNQSGRWKMEDMFALFPILRERADAPAGVLSGGEQQMLTLCRTLMGDPDLLLIDEPTEGLAPKAVAQVSDFLCEMKKRAISVLLVEQKLTISLQISQRLYVMGHGRVVFHGTPDELRENQSVRKEWLEV